MIPTLEWSQILSDELSLSITPPKMNWPLFFVDSEGMGIRGDAFDFITTSPPAIIAKVILIFNLLHQLDSPYNISLITFRTLFGLELKMFKL